MSQSPSHRPKHKTKTKVREPKWAFLDLGSSESDNFYLILTVAHQPQVQGRLEGREEHRHGGENTNGKNKEQSVRLQRHKMQFDFVLSNFGSLWEERGYRFFFLL